LTGGILEMMNEVPEAKAKSPKHPPTISTYSLFVKRLKAFDIYPKIDENYRVQTTGGALLSIFGWILITFLVVFEINSYMTPKFKEHMVVDTSLGQQLRININITFHALTCAEVS